MTLKPITTKLLFLFIYLTIDGCVEPYEFTVTDHTPRLVVEAFISDKSFLESIAFPSNGRYFTARLTMTSDVINTRPESVSGALVELISENEEIWRYSESGAGLYSLLDSTFKCSEDLRYKLRISLPDEHVYESAWEGLPQVEVPPIGDINFREDEKEVYVMEATKWVLKTKEIVEAHINVPENPTDTDINYRWTFTPMWIYKAPIINQLDPKATCWATSKNFINTFALQKDHTGGYPKPLFDVLTVRNAIIYEKLSVLVTQQVMTDEYYQFWKEMKEQNEGSALNDIPPFNLDTNFTCVTGDKKVAGYFGAVKEQAKRWYFSRHDLSYFVENTLMADCLSTPDIAPECTNCLLYSFGDVTNIKPEWWED